MKKLASILALVLVLGCALFATHASAAEYSDIQGHWGEKAVLRWSDYGVLTGYTDGTFRPDAPITRGEFAAILNRVMNFPATEQNFFTDLDGVWCKGEVNALAAQGFYLVPNGKAESDKVITREEAVWMLYRMIPRNHPISLSNTFTDIDEVLPEYQAAVAVYKRAGYINGTGDGSFRPKGAFTRAQVVTILNNMFTLFINEPGTYEAVSDKGDSVCISAPGVTLVVRNTSGDEVAPAFLVVAPGAAGGTTTVSGSGWFLRGVHRGVFYGEHLLSDPDTLVLTSGATFADADTLTALLTRSAWAFTGDIRLLPIRGEPDSRFAGGIGTADIPYLISNEAQLKLLEEYIGHVGYYHHFKLTNDITLTGPWEPIGDSATKPGDDEFIGAMTSGGAMLNYAAPHLKDTAFYGHLDGAGYAIKNVNISYSGTESKALGLFEAIGGSVKNLTVSGKVRGEVAGSYEGSFSSASRVLSAGMIAGMIVEPNGAVIENCTAHADISLTAKGTTAAGGIVGFMQEGSVLNCRADGSIRAVSDTSAAKDTSGTMSHAGGICGVMNGKLARNLSLSDCVSTASIFASGGALAHAGGISGMVFGDATVDRCFTGGTVHAQNGEIQTDAGGIAGYLGQNLFANTPCQVTECVSVADISASGNCQYYNSAGGIAGNAQRNVQIRDCFSAGTIQVSGSAVVGGLVGRNDYIEISSSYAVTKVTAPTLFWPSTSANNIVGPYRDALYVYGCGDFAADTPCFSSFNSKTGEQEIIPLTGKDLFSAATYQTYGGSSLSDPATVWDFDHVWTFSSAGSYRYPVLRWMPDHLIALIK